MTKQALRNLYKQQRLDIPSKDKLKMDDLMLLQFQQFDFSEIRSLLTYWPIGHMNEPNTHLYSSYLRHMVYDLQITYPVADFSTGSMQAILINEDTVYKPVAHEIMEPTDGEVFAAEDIDLIFVPLLAFDEAGYRVGYGKGFYDKYLATCREDAVKIGFSYFPPVEKIEGTDEFDVPLNYCITPENIYEF